MIKNTDGTKRTTEVATSPTNTHTHEAYVEEHPPHTHRNTHTCSRLEMRLRDAEDDEGTDAQLALYHRESVWMWMCQGQREEGAGHTHTHTIRVLICVKAKSTEFLSLHSRQNKLTYPVASICLSGCLSFLTTQHNE